MNLYLFELIAKWVSVLFVSLASFLGLYKEDKIVTENTNKNMSLNMETVILPHSTRVQYNASKPNGEKSVLTQGEDGYVIKNTTNGIQKVMKNPVDEVIEVGTYITPSTSTSNINQLVYELPTIEAYNGKLTAYGGDCCGGKGRVAYVNHNLITQGIFYQDNVYGPLRVLSAARAKFPPGTIIEINSSSTGLIHGIVLDYGGSMDSAWKKGNVWIDLAFSTQADAMRYGSKLGITFNVKRYGW